MDILEKHSGPEKTTHLKAAPQFSFSFIFLNFLEFSLIFFNFLQFSFMFFHVLSCSFMFCSYSGMFFHCFFHFLRFVFFLFFFFFLSNAQNLFFASIALRAVSGVPSPIGPFFFLSILHFFIIVFFFIFPCFSFFSFVFSFFIFYSFIFLLFSSLNVSSFFIVFLFFLYSEAKNLWLHFRIPRGKVHILNWLYLLCIGSTSLYHVE